MYLITYYSNEKEVIQTTEELLSMCEEHMDRIEIISKGEVIHLDGIEGVKKGIVYDDNYDATIITYNDDHKMADYLMKKADRLSEFIRL
tara:strand:- start:14179 stop:14445 length:267 start_codon:yes stop_codon:yes gene_type:complete